MLGATEATSEQVPGLIKLTLRPFVEQINGVWELTDLAPSLLVEIDAMNDVPFLAGFGMLATFGLVGVALPMA